MTRTLLTLIFSAAFVSASAAQSPTEIREVLPNGLVVLVREDPAVGVVADSLLVRSGSAFETAETAGVTNFLQKMMLRGTKHRSALALAEAAEELGGSLDASGDVDYAEIRGTALAAHWEALLALIAEVAIEPTLPEAEIERDAWPALGRPESVKRLRRDALAARYTDAYRADRMVLAVAGGVPRQRVIAAANRLFKRLPGASSAATHRSSSTQAHADTAVVNSSHVASTTA